MSMNDWMLQEDDLKRRDRKNFWKGWSHAIFWECAITLAGALAWLAIHMPAVYYPG